MGININKPDKWKEDIIKSVDLYNDWFMNYAPNAFRETRTRTTKQVKNALKWTNCLRDVSPEIMKRHPSVLPMLRMSTCPPIARVRLIGLSGVSPNLVISMEKNERFPN